jgi:hypothetical protein
MHACSYAYMIYFSPDWLAQCTHLTVGLDSDIRPQSQSPPSSPPPSRVEDDSGLWLEMKGGGEERPGGVDGY